MSNMIEELKAKIGYTPVARGCAGCKFFKEDMTTDNFGPGDLCVRNPDVSFNTEGRACCNRWETIEAKSK